MDQARIGATEAYSYSETGAYEFYGTDSSAGCYVGQGEEKFLRAGSFALKNKMHVSNADFIAVVQTPGT